MRCAFSAISVLAIVLSVPAAARDRPVAPPTYDVLANSFLDAPIVARVRITRAVTVGGADPVPGRARLLLSGQVVALLRGPDAIAPVVQWLADVPRDSRGRVPALKGRSVLVGAQGVPGRPDAVQLTGVDAMTVAAPLAEATVRTLIAESRLATTPGVLTGVARAVHVPGTIAGESETQLLLQGKGDGRAIVSVTRRPGLPPEWHISQGDVVDPDAVTPPRDSVAAHRLRCALPAVLPDAATAALEPDGAQAARADYAWLRAAVGTCAID